MNTIWISPNGSSFSRNINYHTPLASMQDAMHKVMSSSDIFWTIYVAPGYYSNFFSIPENKIITIVGSSRATILGGNCSWKLSGKLSSLLTFKDISIDQLMIVDGSSPASLSLLSLENCFINEITKVGSSKLDIAISSISAPSDIFASSLGAAGAVYGDIKINSYLLGTNIGFFGNNHIFCDHFKLQDCLIEQNIYINNSDSIMKGSEWLKIGTSLHFLNDPGKLLLDHTSYRSFKKKKIQLINGTIERF